MTSPRQVHDKSNKHDTLVLLPRHGPLNQMFSVKLNITQVHHIKNRATTIVIGKRSCW